MKLTLIHMLLETQFEVMFYHMHVVTGQALSAKYLHNVDLHSF